MAECDHDLDRIENDEVTADEHERVCLGQQHYYYECDGTRYGLTLSDLPPEAVYPDQLSRRGCIDGDDCPEGTPGGHVARAVGPDEFAELMADEETDHG
jgi:hypothetical protein